MLAPTPVECQIGGVEIRVTCLVGASARVVAGVTSLAHSVVTDTVALGWRGTPALTTTGLGGHSRGGLDFLVLNRVCSRFLCVYILSNGG